MNQTAELRARKRHLWNRAGDPDARSNPLHIHRARKEVNPSHGPAADGDRDLRRQALLELRARLRGDVAETADVALGNSIAASSASPDAVDCASEIIEQDLALGLLGSAEDTLEQIDAALKRMEDGSYGRCAECGVKIPTVRLEAIPYATCCVSCAARQERAS